MKWSNQYKGVPYYFGRFWGIDRLKRPAVDSPDPRRRIYCCVTSQDLLLMTTHIEKPTSE